MLANGREVAKRLLTEQIDLETDEIRPSRSSSIKVEILIGNPGPPRDDRGNIVDKRMLGVAVMAIGLFT